MSKFEGFKCDVCSKATDDVTDWFHVYQGASDNDAQDVCSPKCMAALGRQLIAIDNGAVAIHRPGKKRANGAGGAGGTSPNETPCPDCGTVFPSRQGFAVHRARAHGWSRSEAYNFDEPRPEPEVVQ